MGEETVGLKGRSIIYAPRGQAGEYAPLATNPYRGCGHKCSYCGNTAQEAPLHVDHVVPVAEGGRTTAANLVTACEACNLGKGAVPLNVVGRGR